MPGQDEEVPGGLHHPFQCPCCQVFRILIRVLFCNLFWYFWSYKCWWHGSADYLNAVVCGVAGFEAAGSGGSGWDTS